MKLKVKDRAELISFLGKSEMPNSFNDWENYWKLIGTTGIVIDTNNINFRNRVLVLFDENLDEMNLENHNPIKIHFGSEKRI